MSPWLLIAPLLIAARGQLYLEIDRCPDLPAKEVKRLVRIELVVELAEAPGIGVPWASIHCEGARTTLTYDRAKRTIDLAKVDARARPRLLALALAELAAPPKPDGAPATPNKAPPPNSNVRAPDASIDRARPPIDRSPADSPKERAESPPRKPSGRAELIDRSPPPDSERDHGASPRIKPSGGAEPIDRSPPSDGGTLLPSPLPKTSPIDRSPPPDSPARVPSPPPKTSGRADPTDRSPPPDARTLAPSPPPKTSPIDRPPPPDAPALRTPSPLPKTSGRQDPIDRSPPPVSPRDHGASPIKPSGGAEPIDRSPPDAPALRAPSPPPKTSGPRDSIDRSPPPDARTRAPSSPPSTANDRSPPPSNPNVRSPDASIDGALPPSKSIGDAQENADGDQPPASELAEPPETEVRASHSATSTTSLHFAASVLGGVTLFTADGPPTFGGRASIELAPSFFGARLDVGASFGSESVERGDVSLLLVGAGLTGFGRFGTPLVVFDVGIGGRVGLARIAGTPADPVATEGATISGAWAGAHLLTRATFLLGPLRLAAEIEGGLVIRPVIGNAGDIPIAAADGAWFTFLLGVGLEP